MSLQFLLMLVLAFAAVIAVVFARTLVHRRATEPDSAPADLAEIARWTARWRWSGVVLGLLLGGAAFPLRAAAGRPRAARTRQPRPGCCGDDRGGRRR